MTEEKEKGKEGMTTERANQIGEMFVKNFHIARNEGCEPRDLRLAASIVMTMDDILAEREGTPKGGEKRPVYDGIIILEQLLHSLKPTIELLHGFGCDSLSDITGYLIQDGQLLFRVKGRLAAAPVNFRHEDIDLLNYTRYYVGLLPLEEETRPLE